MRTSAKQYAYTAFCLEIKEFIACRTAVREICDILRNRILRSLLSFCLGDTAILHFRLPVCKILGQKRILPLHLDLIREWDAVSSCELTADRCRICTLAPQRTSI